MNVSAQRPARDRVLTRIPYSPPRPAALCAELVESAQAAGRPTKGMINSAGLAAPGESVVRDFLQSLSR